MRAEASAGSSEAPELLRQLAAERSQAEEQQTHMASELQALRQQLLLAQQAAARAEAAAKADSSAAAHAERQLLREREQHKAEVCVYGCLLLCWSLDIEMKPTQLHLVAGSYPPYWRAQPLAMHPYPG